MATPKILLYSAIVVIFASARYVSGALFSEATVAGLVISAPFVYWWVVPFICKETMVIPTTASSLRYEDSPILRFVFFGLGLSIYLGGMLL